MADEIPGARGSIRTQRSIDEFAGPNHTHKREGREERRGNLAKPRGQTRRVSGYCVHLPTEGKEENSVYPSNTMTQDYGGSQFLWAG